MFIPGKPVIQAKELIRLLFPPKVQDCITRDNLFLFSRGREALVSGVQLLNVSPKNRIWAPAYICRSAIDPLLKMGYKCAYYDIDKSLKPSWGSNIPDHGDVVIIVHFFGIWQDIEKIKADLGEGNNLFIEDGAHRFPDFIYNKTASVGDIAIYSLKKVLGVPDGGALILNNPEVLEKSRGENHLAPRYLSKLKLIFVLTECVSYYLKINILPLKSLLRKASKPGVMSKAEPISMQTVSILEKVQAEFIVRKRLKNYENLASLLSDVKEIEIPLRKLPINSIPQVLPICTKCAKQVVQKVRRKGLEVYQWPGIELPRDINLDEFKGAKRWSNQGVMLPVHQNLNEKQIEVIARELKKSL
ncbi:DegT/DnrJ/EryC1/StrS family aminotransferase [Thermodesulfobacteriota bacterium]